MRKQRLAVWRRIAGVAVVAAYAAILPQAAQARADGSAPAIAGDAGMGAVDPGCVAALLALVATTALGAGDTVPLSGGAAARPVRWRVGDAGETPRGASPATLGCRADRVPFPRKPTAWQRSRAGLGHPGDLHPVARRFATPAAPRNPLPALLPG
jgi:hypothetical protein